LHPIKRILKIGVDSRFIFGYISYYENTPEYEPVSGNIYTIGSEGFLNWYGKFYGNISFYKYERDLWSWGEIVYYYFFSGIHGFRGIRISLFGTCYFFGYAEKVKLSYNTPPH
jgi:hypothetical protein